MAGLIKVARLPFLIVGVVLFVLGALLGVLAGGHLSVGPLVLGYFGVAAARLSVHFSNDYFDAKTDSPGASTLISGGGDVLLDHPELREPVRQIAIALLCISLAAGVALVVLYAFPLWTLGLVLMGNSVGWFYSAPPPRLSERGWGEACYVFAAGFLEPGVGYLATRGTLDAGGLFMLAPLLIYALVSILNVEMPDLEADHAGGKRTWIEQRGRSFGFAATGLLLPAATAYFFLLPVLFPSATADGRVLGLLSMVPLAPGLVALFRHPADRLSATRMAIATVTALVVFGLLVDAYLFALTRR